LVIGLSLPSNLVLLLIGLFGILSHAPELYLTRDEAAVINWLRSNSSAGEVVLAGPEMGLYIPAQTGLRVIYGHPFETVNAEIEEQNILDVYLGELNGRGLEALLVKRRVDFIVYGEREQALGGSPDFLNYPVVFEQGKSRIFAASERP
jgi:hypothetical protein